MAHDIKSAISVSQNDDFVFVTVFRHVKFSPVNKTDSEVEGKKKN